MQIKLKSDAEVYQTCKYSKSIGRIVLNVRQEEIVDADELQIQKNAVKPRVIRGVIVA